MKIEAKLRYAYQAEALVTIIDVYNDSSDELWVIFIDEDGMIRQGMADSFEVIDSAFLPTK